MVIPRSRTREVISKFQDYIDRVLTLVLKVWKNNIAFSRLKKCEKNFFSHVGMENENIFPDLTRILIMIACTFFLFSV